MLSIPHLIIIFIVALVVFGPEKLPDLARNLGKFMGEFKRHTGDLRSTFEGHLRDLEREADQRRMRHEAQVAATPIPPAQLPETSDPIPGSIATVPPHIAGVDSAADYAPQPVVPIDPAASISPAPHPAADPVADPAVEHPSSPLEPGHNPETLTDAGIHPA